jgi:hypothetical protein
MKQAILTILLIAITCLMFAEGAADEALSSLDNAKSLIQSKSYVKAQDEINFALSKVSELLSEDLIKFIPDAPAGWKQDEKSSAGLGQAGGFMGSANAITATGEYSKGEEGSVKITISVGGFIGKSAGLMGLGALYGGSSGTKNSKSIRIAGYTGTNEYNTEDKDGKLTIQVGEKISVNIEGNGLENADVLKSFTTIMDLPKLEKSF